MLRYAISALPLLLLAAYGLARFSDARPHISRSGVLSQAVAIPREARVLDVLRAANALREEAGLKRLTVHPTLQLALDDYAREGVKDGLDGAFRFAGQRIPAIRLLAGNLVYEASDERVFRELEKWTDVLDPAHTHLAVQFFEEPQHGRTGCIAVLASVYPEFHPPMRSHGVTGFFTTCRWCGHGHGVSVEGGGQTTLVIGCPNCHRTADLVATDSDGYWRRANQFLTSRGGRGAAGGLAEVMEIWKNLSSRNRYQKDAERIGGADTWSLPEETLRRGVGDCEDTSLALAQQLLERGYEVRVVLGKQKGQGHAWCVLRLDGQAYLLESTLTQIEAERPPFITERAFDYEPEYQFDAARIYFKAFEGWTGEYWSEDFWSSAETKATLSASL